MKLKNHKFIFTVLTGLIFSAVFSPFAYASEPHPYSYVTQATSDDLSSQTTITPTLYGIWLTEVYPEYIDVHLIYKILDITTLSTFSGAGDGSVYHQNASWSTAHDAATGTAANYTDTTLNVRTGKTGDGGLYRIERAFLPFNTASLPDNAQILEARLKTYAGSKTNADNDGDDFITVIQTSQPSTTALTTADYDLAGAISNPTEGIDTTERKDITSITTGQYLTFTLNSTGKSWASTTGYTLLGLREGHDVLNTAFTGSSNQYNGLTIRTSEFTGTSTDPILEITYATSSVPTTATYSYDPDGFRVKETVATTSSASTYYPTKFYSTNGTTPTKSIFLPDGTLIATVVGTGTTTTVSYIHTDHLGGTNVATNDSGEVVQLLDYYPYGDRRLDEQSGHDEKRKFASYVFDGDTGLNYLNQRYLNTNNARFLSQDQVFLAMGDNGQMKQMTQRELWEFLSDPQMLNSYGYARNNPLGYVDSEGQFAIAWAPAIPGLPSLSGLAGFTGSLAAGPVFVLGGILGIGVALSPIGAKHGTDDYETLSPEEKATMLKQNSDQPEVKDDGQTKNKNEGSDRKQRETTQGGLSGKQAQEEAAKHGYTQKVKPGSIGIDTQGKPLFKNPDTGEYISPDRGGALRWNLERLR